jgi:hypothetical protein
MRVDSGSVITTTVVLACLGWALATATLAAPPAEKPAEKEIDKNLPKQEADIQAILRNAKIQPNEQALFDSYFNDYLL